MKSLYSSVLACSLSCFVFVVCAPAQNPNPDRPIEIGDQPPLPPWSPSPEESPKSKPAPTQPSSGTGTSGGTGTGGSPADSGVEPQRSLPLPIPISGGASRSGASIIPFNLPGTPNPGNRVIGREWRGLPPSPKFNAGLVKPPLPPVASPTTSNWSSNFRWFRDFSTYNRLVGIGAGAAAAAWMYARGATLKSALSTAGRKAVFGAGAFATGTVILLTPERISTKSQLFPPGPVPSPTPRSRPSHIDKDKMADSIDRNVQKTYHGKCATNCRWALHAAGIDTTGHPRYAKDYGPFLEDQGFSSVPLDNNYVPQKGDVAVFGGNEKHPAGHIQIYDGKGWVSDCKQRGFSPYSGSTPPSTIYRFDDHAG
jgi:hypothetical protein